MDRTKLALLATVIVLAVNAAANIVPLGGLNTGQLSALYPTGFTPPGYVFGIWSIIYLGLIAFSIAALRAVPRTRARIERIIGPYLLNAVGNCAWIIVWHSRMVLVSVLVMLFIPKSDESTVKGVAVLTAAATLAVGIYTLLQFDYDKAGTLQFFTTNSWSTFNN